MKTQTENPYNDGIPSDSEGTKTNKVILWFLAVLPLGIAFGTGWGLYRHFSQQEIAIQKASKKISRSEITQILENWSQTLGSRSFSTKEEIDQLSLGAKMLSGELQTTNSGLINMNDNGSYQKTGRAWPTYWADIAGSESSKVFFIATSYDGKQSLRNGAKIALMLSVAKSFAAETLDFTLRFAFVPEEQELVAQQQWIEDNCLSPSESSLGIFFLAHGETDLKDNVRKDSWKVSGGDTLWANEILKESRVMQYGVANLHHGVLNRDEIYTKKDAARVEAAAKGLRNILFLAMGGDR